MRKLPSPERLGRVGPALTGLLLQRFGPVVTVLVTFAPQLALAVVTTCYRRLRAAT